MEFLKWLWNTDWFPWVLAILLITVVYWYGLDWMVKILGSMFY